MEYIQNKGNAPLIIAVLWAICSLGLSLGLQNQYSLGAHNILVLGTLISYILCIQTWKSAGGSYASIYVFFISYALLSNLGASIVYSTLSWTNSSEFLKIYEMSSWYSIVTMLRFQIICVAFLNLGTAICVSKRLIAKPSGITSNKTEGLQFSERLWFACLIFHLYLGVHYVFLRSSMTYVELDRQMISEDWGIIGTISTYLYLYFAVLMLAKGRKIDLVYASLLVLSLLFMVAGKRYMAIRFIGALAVFLPLSHPQYFKKKYAWAWVGIVMSFLAFINILRMTRGDSLSSVSVDEKGFFDLILGTFAEMGQSEWPAIIIMDMLDGTGQHVYTLFTAFSRTFGLDALLGYETSESLGRFVTNSMGANYGLGGSYIAEAFANFGWFGCLYTLIYGWIIVYLEIFAYRNLNNYRYRWISIAIIVLLLRQVFYARAQLDLAAFDMRCLFVIWVYTQMTNRSAKIEYQ